MAVNAREFKMEDAGSYDTLAAEFDRFTEKFSTPLIARMIALAELVAGQRVLDIGTGTGAVALCAAEKIGPEGRVVGVDLSSGMLELAKAKAAQAGLSNRVEFRSMDAEALDFEGPSFNVALCLFALLHFPDPLRALKEMLRVLYPGGKLVVAVGSGPPWMSLRCLVHRVTRLFDALLEFQGKRLFAPAFLNALVAQHIGSNGDLEETALARANHARTRSVQAVVHEAGFTNVRCCWETHRAVVETPEEFWDLQRTFSSIARKRLSRVTPKDLDTLREHFFRACRGVQARGGQLIYQPAAFYVIAQRPFSEKRP